MAEQDPADWWRSVCDSCREAMAAAEKGAGKAAGREIRGVVFSAARQTFVLVDLPGSRSARDHVVRPPGRKRGRRSR